MHQPKTINYLAVCGFILFCFGVSTSANAQVTSHIDCFLPAGWDGKEAKLVVSVLHKPPLIDTATIVNRHAIFTVDIAEYSPAYIWLEGHSSDIHFFLDSPKIYIAVDPKTFDEPLFSGSPSSELWLNQQRLIRELNLAQNRIRDDFFAVLNTTDSLLSDSLSVALVKFEPTADSLDKAHNKFVTQLILDSPEAASSWYLFTSNFSNLPYSTVLALFTKLAYFQFTPSYKRISETLSQNKIGHKVSPFDWLTATENKMRAANQWGKFTLLDFSVSYVVSHQRRHRALKKLYALYHPLGLEIFTVSNGFSHESDQDFSGKERLPWPIIRPILNTPSKQAGSPFERTFDNLLIDAQGTIIGRDLSVQDLRSMLQDLFKKD